MFITFYTVENSATFLNSLPTQNALSSMCNIILFPTVFFHFQCSFGIAPDVEKVNGRNF